VEELFVCSKCGNKDPNYVGYLNGKPYCRKCIAFRGEEKEYKQGSFKNVSLQLDYRLSKEQTTLSNKIIENYFNGIDTLVYAVCGSGKTEISYGIIGRCMAKGYRVGFALPRRDVVIELFFRLKAAFPSNKIVAVYGQHTSRLEGDCIILTTHQLYRYESYFDLLVMDEIDAFPFKGSEVLISFYKRAVRGHVVMMSATPSKEIRKEFSKPNHDIVELHTRFHKHPIPVPVEVKRIGILKEIFIIKKLIKYKKEKKPCLIFTPTIETCEKLFFRLNTIVKGGNYVSSERDGRSTIIDDFKNSKYSYLVSTAVLERGVTIKNVQVIIYNADSLKIYNSAALIQIAGRAGRKSDAPTGDVYFLCKKSTKPIRNAIKEIKFCNKYL